MSTGRPLLQHGIASDYGPHIIMNQIDPYQTEVEGSTFISDKDSYPVLRKPTPSLQPPVPGLSQLLSDPNLCVTPEKGGTGRKSSPKAGKVRVQTQSLNRGSDEGLVSDRPCRPLNSDRVRFDTVVEVKQLSPDPSLLTVCEGGSQGQIIGQQAPSSGASPQNVDDEWDFSSPCLDKSGETYGPEDKFGTKYVIPKTQYSPPRDGNVDVVDVSSEYKSSTYGDITGAQSSHQGVRTQSSRPSDSSDLEPLSVFASDLRRSAQSTSSLENSTKLRKGASTQSQVSHKVVPRRETSSPVTGVTCVNENVLARPEFNSTVRVGKELQELRESELDVAAAVEQKLRVSSKARSQVDEKVREYSKSTSLSSKFKHIYAC